MRKTIIFIFLIFHLELFSEERSFKENLSEMHARIEASIKILRNQIVENQSAPFLADLYMQLGELLTQKANTLYYIQMETGKGPGSSTPIIKAQREAISVFSKVLKEFPSYSKRAKVLYLISFGYKNIGENENFIKTVNTLIKNFPESIEAIRGRLILGSYFIETKSYDKALDILSPVLKSQHAYERNLAQYRVGVVYSFKEKWLEALQAFEKVISDESFIDEEREISLENRGLKSTLKQEALTDSVKAFTYVYKKDPDPVGYYSRICPTEFLFQDVIQKLSFRYIFLKEYQTAIKLLRVLAERIPDPETVVNIYKEVLLGIPLEKRVEIPVIEMTYLLEHYKAWIAFYDLNTKTKEEAFRFFEKQIRDLGTRNHDLAKANKEELRKTYSKRAEDYYLLYLGFFPNTSMRAKIATNLADLYYMNKNYILAAEYYLRTFDGEFGKPKKPLVLLNNAIISAEKNEKYSFYDQLRARGLLIRAVKTMLAQSIKARKNPRYHFILAKAKFEQGFYTDAIDELYNFVKAFPSSKYAVLASELILDYYNTRADYNGLSGWSSKLMKIKMKDKKFLAKLKKINEVANLKNIDEIVKSQKNYDVFEEGKSYLKTALETDNRELASLILDKALDASKKEGDIETFILTAQKMAQKENNRDKKLKMELSIINEKLNLTRYYESLKDLKTLQMKGDNSNKFMLFKERLRIALALRDFKELESCISDPLWSKVDIGMKKAVLDIVINGVQSINSTIIENLIIENNLDDRHLINLFKNISSLTPKVKQKLNYELQKKCQIKNPLCNLIQLQKLDTFSKNVLNPDNASSDIEKFINDFDRVKSGYEKIEGSLDPEFDALIKLRLNYLYNSLGKYLDKQAQSQSDISDVLKQKAKESYLTASNYLKTCQLIINKTVIISPILPFCKTGKNPNLDEAFVWSRKKFSKNNDDSNNIDIIYLQKKLFKTNKGKSELSELGDKYFNIGFYNHSVALGTLGGLKNPSTNSLMACSLIRLGLYEEGRAFLRNASEIKLKEYCKNDIKDFGKEL